MSDKLIHGKSGIQGIVGLEVNGPTVEIFIQDKDGKVKSICNSHRYWILSDQPFRGKCKKLDGDLHYKYGFQTPDQEQFNSLRQKLKWSQDIYSIYNSEEACMIKDGYTYYQGLQPKDLSVLSFDIETTGLDGNSPDAKVVLISTTYRDKNETVNKLFSYDDFEDEKEMIEYFCMYVMDCDPSLIVGHNILSFDFPYLQARADIAGVQLKLGRDVSPIKFNSYKSKFRIDGTRTQEYNNVTIYGREIVDTYFLAVSFDVSKSIETYALKPMIKQLGLEKEGRQFYDAGSIRENYKIPAEWEKIKQYAVEDAEDTIKLWDMMGSAKFYWAQKVPKPFSELLLGATGSQINSLMLRAYLQDGHSIPRADLVDKFQGAISMGVPGIYSNCMKIDVSSLYPSIILQYEVYDKDKDPNGYFLQIVSILTKARLEHKKLAKETGSKYYGDLQESEKIGINSAYGFLAAKGLNFNCLEAADFITGKGREILQYAIKWACGEELKLQVEEETLEDE